MPENTLNLNCGDAVQQENTTGFYCVEPSNFEIHQYGEPVLVIQPDGNILWTRNGVTRTVKNADMLGDCFNGHCYIFDWFSLRL